LVRASYGCYDFATYYKTPFISGKDSLYNEYTVKGKRISIPGTLLISAMSVIDDYNKVITSSFKKKENLIYLVGVTKNELGCSEYFRAKGLKGGIVPKVNKNTAMDVLQSVSKAMDKGLVESCHDLSEGGLAVAAAEMCISSGLGANIFLGEVKTEGNLGDYEALFSESPTRFLVEVDKAKKDQFEKVFGKVSIGLVGCVLDDKSLVVYGKDGKEIIEQPIADLKASWLKTFDEFRYEKA
jgi:phosphoribosylformylglycinamidine synthase